MGSYYVCSFLLLSVLATSFSMIADTTPQANTTIAGFEGEGDIVLECSVYDDVNRTERQITQWSLEDTNAMPVVVRSIQSLATFDVTFNLTGDERNDTVFPSFDNVLTLLNFTADLDGQTLFCGTGGALGDPLVAGFPLRLYRAPDLIDLGSIDIDEDSVNISYDFSGNRPPFPFPQQLTWTFNGETVENSTDQRVTFGYPDLSFASVLRGDSGDYSLTAISFLLNDSSTQVGNDTGMLSLNVLYGPEFVEGPSLAAVIEANSVVLVCATEVDGNPFPSVEWTDPNGNLVSQTDPRFMLSDSVSSVASLTILNATVNDSGEWLCRVFTLQFSGASRNITLRVIAPPSEPTNVTVDSITARSATLSWEAPVFIGLSTIVQYQVNATQEPFDVANPPFSFLTDDATRRIDLAGLLPGLDYRFSVAAIAEYEDVVNDVVLTVFGAPSGTVNATTLETVPAPRCIEQPASQNGVISIQWSYVHTGGLNLTQVLVQSFNADVNGFELLENGNLTDLESSSFDAEGFTAGESYVFRILAFNDLGFGQADCPAVLHRIGVPGRPNKPGVSSPASGVLEVELSTQVSGIEDGGSLTFVIEAAEAIEMLQMPTSFGETAVTRVEFGDYSDGDMEEAMLEELTAGVLYRITVNTENEFGSSEQTEAVVIRVRQGSTSSQTGAIAGGVIGGILVLILVVAIIVIIVGICCILCKRDGEDSKGESEMVDNSAYAGFKKKRAKQGSGSDGDGGSEEEEEQQGVQNQEYNTIPGSGPGHDFIYDSLDPLVDEKDDGATKGQPTPTLLQTQPGGNEEDDGSVYDNLEPQFHITPNPLYSSTSELRSANVTPSTTPRHSAYRDTEV